MCFSVSRGYMLIQRHKNTPWLCHTFKLVCVPLAYLKLRLQEQIQGCCSGESRRCLFNSSEYVSEEIFLLHPPSSASAPEGMLLPRCCWTCCFQWLSSSFLADTVQVIRSLCWQRCFCQEIFSVVNNRGVNKEQWWLILANKWLLIPVCYLAPDRIHQKSLVNKMKRQLTQKYVFNSSFDAGLGNSQFSGVL